MDLPEPSMVGNRVDERWGSPEHRFAVDPDFRTLVSMLEHFITKAQFTPTEMREAVILACIHYEMNNVRAYMAPKDSLGAVHRAQSRLDKLENMLRMETGG